MGASVYTHQEAAGFCDALPESHCWCVSEVNEEEHRDKDRGWNGKTGIHAAETNSEIAGACDEDEDTSDP